MSKSNNTAPSIYTTVDVISTEILAGDMLLATLGRIHAGACSSYRYVVILDMKGKKAVRKYSTIGEATQEYNSVIEFYNELTNSLDKTIDKASSDILKRR